MEKKIVSVGLVGFGLDTYWTQFGNLYERLCGYQDQIAIFMKNMNVRVVNVGIVDNPVRARECADSLQKEGISLLFIYISTYALSSTVLPLVA